MFQLGWVKMPIHMGGRPVKIPDFLAQKKKALDAGILFALGST